MYKNQVWLQVLVNDKAIHEYSHEGQMFIEGRKGNEYTIRVKNDSSFRRKVVVSVDGLNVITGDSTWKNGYVLDPWASITIPGWRKDNTSVANFEFSSVSGSYNQQNVSGDVNNVGVIGVMAFNEKPKPVPVYNNSYITQDSWYPKTASFDNSWSGSSSTYGTLQSRGVQCASLGSSGPLMMNAASASPISSRTRSKSKAVEEKASATLGTGWGDNSEFKTKTVYYDFEESPIVTLSLFYDSRRNLELRGIDVRDYTISKPTPNAFPGVVGCPEPIRRYR